STEAINVPSGIFSCGVVTVGRQPSWWGAGMLAVLSPEPATSGNGYIHRTEGTVKILMRGAGRTGRNITLQRVSSELFYFAQSSW
ncbi:MAG: hypothetical protein ABI614_29055, partial [Planctomycetota bacterium]